MLKIQKELQSVYEKYSHFDFIRHYQNVTANNKTPPKYSKGIGFLAGLYEPSYVLEMRITNWTVGKEVQKPDRGFDYKYYFDESGRILLSEKYLEKTPAYLNFYFYEEGVCEFIHYEIDRNSIYFIAKSDFDRSGRISRHIEAELMGYGVEDACFYEEHLFRYTEDSTYVTVKKYMNPSEQFDKLRCLQTQNGEDAEEGIFSISHMMIRENVLYFLDGNGKVQSFFPIRFKLVNGQKVSVPLPKKVPVFKIIKENMIGILSKWKGVEKSVIWILCESTDLVMQYTCRQEDCEEKWNIAFYDTEEEAIFTEKEHIQAFEDILFNAHCDLDDLLGGKYFTDKMIRIVKELRKEGYIAPETAVVLSGLEISEETFAIAQKINSKETAGKMANAFGVF